MAMFSGAHNFEVSGGQFNVNNINNGPNGIDILIEASVPDAAVDAEARRYAPSCFPGTREQYIDDITNWATASNNDQIPPIYWMRGPAGVGKSAIAQTCARKVKDARQLGAAFFFSVNGRNDHRRFFTTLACQLSTVLPDYRKVLDSAVQNDKLVVTKAISSQFSSLIIEPLRELVKQGKEVPSRAIFIDGLDECSSTDAQREIIEIIAASVRDKSTPFRWAIFSRAEAHIVSTFARTDVSLHTRSVLLPISRDCDGEIEIYLRGGFENMLRRRDLPLSLSWPTDEAIKSLVDASAGLFAYPAAVLRFIDRHSYSGFKERLEAVLSTILHPNARQPHSPFAELDAFYILIMKRIPEDILPFVLLLLGDMVEISKFDEHSWDVALLCNSLGLSDTDFRGVLNALRPVLIFQGPSEPPIFDENIDLARSYFDQDESFSVSINRLYQVHGTVNFYHKSFYDFLIDPIRSLTFCVTTSAIRKKLFHCYVQPHLHHARSLVTQGTKAVLAPDTPGSFVSLSWPQGTEFVDSFLKSTTFRTVSWRFCHDFQAFALYLKDVPPSLLQTFAELDYREHLVSRLFTDGYGLFKGTWVIGCKVGETRSIAGTIFQRILPESFSVLDLAAFLTMNKKLEASEIIRPYHRHLHSTFASAYYTLSQQLRTSEKRCGLYKLGRGEKSVIWYWELDTEKRYFHEFRTMNFVEAKRIYEAERFKIWEEDWKMPS